MSASHDQAAGLRAWAAEQGQEATSKPESVVKKAESKPGAARKTAADKPAQRTPLKDLLVLAHPNASQVHQHAYAALVRYHEQGWQWVGSPEQWQVRTCAPSDPNFAQLAENIPRWALWVDGDLQSFQRAYRTLQDLRATGLSMSRMLLMHPPLESRRGLINNVQQMARDFFHVDLLVLQR